MDVAAASEAPERWVVALRADDGTQRAAAVARLHEVLLRATRFEVRRRSAFHPHLRGGDLDDLAFQAADDALVAVLRKLDDYRGESRFTTWAYKFGLFEAAVKVRRLAWQAREVPLVDDTWSLLAAAGSTPAETVEQSDLLRTLARGVDSALSDRQREVFVALALNGKPIDVLADELGSTRGALYKMLHDARHKLRSYMAAEGFEEVDR